MISFIFKTVFDFAIQFVTDLQFVQCLDFDLVVSFVQVTQTFTHIGINFNIRKNSLHDGYCKWVAINRESFTRILSIRTLSVYTSLVLQWETRGV